MTTAWKGTRQSYSGLFDWWSCRNLNRKSISLLFWVQYKWYKFCWTANLGKNAVSRIKILLQTLWLMGTLSLWVEMVCIWWWSYVNLMILCKFLWSYVNLAAWKVIDIFKSKTCISSVKDAYKINFQLQALAIANALK